MERRFYIPPLGVQTEFHERRVANELTNVFSDLGIAAVGDFRGRGAHCSRLRASEDVTRHVSGDSFWFGSAHR